MRAKVLLKRHNGARFALEDGRTLSVPDVRQINAGLQWGDEGTIVQLPNGNLKFIIDSIEVNSEATPYPVEIIENIPETPIQKLLEWDTSEK